LTVTRKIGHWFLFPDSRIALDVLADFRGEDEEAAVNPAAVAARLFLKARHLAALAIDRAVSSRGLCPGYGGKAALAAVKGNAFGDVDVGNAVTVGQAKRIVITDIRQDFLDPAADHGVFAGIDQGYAPGFGMLLQNLHPVFAQVEGDVGLMQKIVREIFLDDVALVA